ncbi:MAG: hypothetical protein AB7P04_14045 [Bacteriovoracia bacterium]
MITYLRPARSWFYILLVLSLILPAGAIPSAQADPAGARSQGVSDGSADGAREGNERGPAEGRQAGLGKGFQDGFNKCEREEKERYYREGYRTGLLEGERIGRYDGDRAGEIDGRNRGDRDGDADGIARADRDAASVAVPLGTQRGIDEANRSDAPQRGDRDGIIAGDQEAQETARRVDYPRGRKDYRDARMAEAVENRDTFSQRAFGGFAPDLLGEEAGETHGLTAAESMNFFASPDNRYYKPRRTYPSDEENRAYLAGYGSGYPSGFQSAYNGTYNNAYNAAYNAGYNDGCAKARAQDYRQDRVRGYNDGYRDGYAQEYRRAYDRAYADAYRDAFRDASEAAYRRTYDAAYARHYEDARQRAYAQRVNELYTAAYNAAKRRKYDEVYPTYAAQQYKLGQADEAEDFRLRPVRVQSAQVTETIVNGLYEPGEPLRLTVQLRNFDASALAGRDIQFQLEALDANSAVISEASATLKRDLRRKSVTDVTEALEFRMNESAVNQAKAFVLKAFYQGRQIGNSQLVVTAKFMTVVTYAEPPELQEGIESPVKMKVTNQSQAATEANLLVTFESKPEDLQITVGSAAVGVLQPGESRVVEFRAIARKPGSSIKIPVFFSANLGPADRGGRRVGLLDEMKEIPLKNDYRIGLKNSIGGLRKAGTTRAEYVITNISSRVSSRGLQLKASFLDDADANLVVLGPNPQYLKPIRRGKSLSFVIPVMSKRDNDGGTLVLEVQEDGRTVVVHQAKF